MLKIKENNKNVYEYNLLYDLVGWGAYDNEITKRALDNTFYSISIYDDDNIIGYGRLIGDSICFLYVQDIMVKPEYQGKQIGSLIMNKLLKKIYENIIKAGFKHVELVPIHIREYYKTKEDFLALLLKTPILADFSEIEENKKTSDNIKIDDEKLEKYILENTTEKGILLIRRYYGITAIK